MGNKSEATWHPGDGPVNEIRSLIREGNGLIESGDYDTSDWARRIMSALVAETLRADQASTELETLRKVYVEDVTGWQEMHAEQMERADRAERRIAEALVAIRGSQQSEWVRELQSSIQHVSFAGIVEAERILSAAPTTEQEAK